MTEPAALGHITFWGEQASEDIAEKIVFKWQFEKLEKKDNNVQGKQLPFVFYLVTNMLRICSNPDISKTF